MTPTSILHTLKKASTFVKCNELSKEVEDLLHPQVVALLKDYGCPPFVGHPEVYEIYSPKNLKTIEFQGEKYIVFNRDKGSGFLALKPNDISVWHIVEFDNTKMLVNSNFQIFLYFTYLGNLLIQKIKWLRREYESRDRKYFGTKTVSLLLSLGKHFDKVDGTVSKSNEQWNEWWTGFIEYYLYGLDEYLPKDYVPKPH